MIIPSPLPQFAGCNFFNQPKIHVYENAIYTCGIGHSDNQQGIFSQDGHLITSGAFYHKYPAQTKGNPISIDPVVAKNFPIIEDAYFAGHFHDQYGHFITECLPRIWAYKQLNLKMPILVRTVNRSVESLSTVRWVQDLLSLLDLQPSDFICPTTPIRIKNLTIPDPLFAEQGFCYKHMADFCHTLGDKAMASLPEDSLIKNSNIYVSRSKIGCGTVTIDNERIVEEKLAALGFVIVHPEQYHVQEQISFFRNNNIVIGPVGSAFHTSIFSPNPQGVGINAKTLIDINYLTMDGANSASIDYIVHNEIINSRRPNGNFYNTKTVKDPDKFVQDIYNFVIQKRKVFSIPNMGKNAIAYKPNIMFQKIKCTKENQELIVRVDSRTGLLSTKEDNIFNDLILVTLKTSNQPNQSFLMINSDTPNVIKHNLIAAPILPVSIKQHKNKVSLYIKSIDKYFVTSNDDKVNFETYSLVDFDDNQERKDGLELLCSILSSVLDPNSYSNMEYYINIYPDLVNMVFNIKNSFHRNTILIYGSDNDGFIPVGNQTSDNSSLRATIITHRSGSGNIIVKGNIDTGLSYTSGIEAINITLNPEIDQFVIKYSAITKGSQWSKWSDDGTMVGTQGQGKAIIGFSAKVFDQNQKEIPCICNAQFLDDDTIHSYTGGTLFTSPKETALIGFSVYLEKK